AVARRNSRGLHVTSAPRPILAMPAKAGIQQLSIQTGTWIPPAGTTKGSGRAPLLFFQRQRHLVAQVHRQRLLWRHAFAGDEQRRGQARNVASLRVTLAIGPTRR